MTLTTAAADPVLLTVEEVARVLRISRGKAYALAQSGDLPVVRMGRSVRVRRDRLEVWLDERSSR